MTQSRYSEKIIIQDAVDKNLIKSPDQIQYFQYAHFRGMRALLEYYTNVPRSMMSVVYRPPKESGSKILQKLSNFQYDGRCLDDIIKNETAILKDQIQHYNNIINHNSKTTILTKDEKYTLPTHTHVQISADDLTYIDVRRVVVDQLQQNKDLLRTRADVEKFVKSNTHLPSMDPDDDLCVDKLISYLILRKTL